MSTRSIETGNLGFPRIGLHRELKFALERFWAGEWNAGQLETAGRKVRGERWQMQAASGIHHIPSNDFSLYDHVLDTAVLAGAIPARYRDGADAAGLATYFAMARGSHSVPAMEMTKWFDTNYHYVVPEFELGMTFRAVSRKPVEEFLEARELGLATRPVLLGPVSFVLLGKLRHTHLDHSNLGIALGEVYAQVLNELASAGAAWVQIDEPYLGLDLAAPYLRLFSGVYDSLAARVSGIKILLTTYFSELGENLDLALRLPVAGLHLDLVRAPGQLSRALERAPVGLLLSLGVVDGRNVWRTDLGRALEMVRRAVDRLGPERIQIAPSCSLMHVPIDLDEERQLDPDVRPWLAFARQKLEEINVLARATAEDGPAISRAVSPEPRGRGRSPPPRAGLQSCGARARGGDRASNAGASQYVHNQAAQASPGHAFAGASHYHHRILPADAGGSSSARRPPVQEIGTNRIRSAAAS
jgi:5-methyltetrahydropteroyltriglutamate--homocysteine methyltransferase